MSDWSKPVQFASFHPSPYQSLIERVHDEPYTTVALPEYGAPPLTLVPSVHKNVQLTSDGQLPELTLMALVIPDVCSPRLALAGRGDGYGTVMTGGGGEAGATGLGGGAGGATAPT